MWPGKAWTSSTTTVWRRWAAVLMLAGASLLAMIATFITRSYDEDTDYHVPADEVARIENARRVNPGIEVLQVSATTGEGMQAWVNWLMHLEPTL